MRASSFALIIALFVPSFALSQSDRINMPVSHSEIAFEDGLKFGVRLGIATDWEFNQYMPGLRDGHFLRLGGSLKATLVYLAGNHEWRNKLVFAEMFTKTPIKSDFLKSHDRLGFESLYMWSFLDWAGAYGRFNFETAALPGEDVQDDAITYRIYALDNTSTTVTAERLHLTDAFTPSYLKESIGLFARPINLGYLTLETKVGGYALQGFANGQRKLSGVNGAGELEIRPLGNFNQIGPTLGLFFFGDIVPELLFYQLNADLGCAAYESSVTGITNSFGDHLYFSSNAELTFKLFDFLQFTYEIRVLHIPAITTGIQIDNKLKAEFPFSI